MSARVFRLYPEEQRWWSFNDYGAVLDVMAELKPKRVLEFGPGSSTLALIEGGAEYIATCEDDAKWFGVYAERLGQKFNGIVDVVRYTWADPLSIPSVDEQRFDLALIDGPHNVSRRVAVLRYALARCAAVLIPTEDSDEHGGLRAAIAREAELAGASVRFMETGPLSGGFAMVTPC